MKVLATYSIKGGVGKTSAAVNLAASSARAGWNVLLWDLDPQGAATYLFRTRAKVKGGSRAPGCRVRDVAHNPQLRSEAIGNDSPTLSVQCARNLRDRRVTSRVDCLVVARGDGSDRRERKGCREPYRCKLRKRQGHSSHIPAIDISPDSLDAAPY